jgi:hypothetical protein
MKTQLVRRVRIRRLGGDSTGKSETQNGKPENDSKEIHREYAVKN